MAVYESVRPANAFLALDIQASSGAYEAPDPATDGVAVEGGSVTPQSAFRTDDSTELTGSLVAGIPSILRAPGSLSFTTFQRGVGGSTAYAAGVYAPAHKALQACGKKGIFTAAIAPAAPTGGAGNTVTLPLAFAATAQKYRGMPLILKGTGVPDIVTFITDYTAARVATLTHTLSAGQWADVDTVEMPANWTYCGTSPSDAATRATDWPYASIGFWEDGTFESLFDARGRLTVSAQAAGIGRLAFTFTGQTGAEIDQAIPPTATVKQHGAPLLLQGDAAYESFVIGGLPLPISQFSFADEQAIDSDSDPNTESGFSDGSIGQRRPVLTCDPRKALKATWDVNAQIEAQTRVSGVAIFGRSALNRVAHVWPSLVPIARDRGERNGRRINQMQYRAESTVRDADGRDGDHYIVMF